MGHGVLRAARGSGVWALGAGIPANPGPDWPCGWPWELRHSPTPPSSARRQAFACPSRPALHVLSPTVHGQVPGLGLPGHIVDETELCGSTKRKEKNNTQKHTGYLDRHGAGHTAAIDKFFPPASPPSSGPVPLFLPLSASACTSFRSRLVLIILIRPSQPPPLPSSFSEN